MQDNNMSQEMPTDGEKDKDVSPYVVSRDYILNTSWSIRLRCRYFRMADASFGISTRGNQTAEYQLHPNVTFAASMRMTANK
jgi:hypothetical protein